MSSKIFISYASEDYAYASELYNILKKNSFIPWMDKKDLLPGQEWEYFLGKALRSADFIILLLSSVSVDKRGYIQREFKKAVDFCEEKLSSDIFIIPIKIDSCEVPPILSKFQWVEYSSHDSFNKIIQSINLQKNTNNNRSKLESNFEQSISGHELPFANSKNTNKDYIQTLHPNNINMVNGSKSLSRSLPDEDELKYFKKYRESEENPLRDECTIDYARSFNLLLYMFKYEKFIEFRAFDMAFVRWEELIMRDNPAQIKNFSKDIFSELNFLITNSRCSNFRRILVIPVSSIQPVTFEVLKIISYLEEKTILELVKSSRHQRADVIFETRILSCKLKEYDQIFRELKDFALFTGDGEEFAIVEDSLISPFQKYNDRICKIITNHPKLEYRKEKFDWLWAEKTKTISEFLSDFASSKSASQIYAIFKLFLSNNGILNIKKSSIIIETVYVDLVNILDERRKFLYSCGFELLNTFLNIFLFENLEENVFADTFINDFRPSFDEDPSCQSNCNVTTQQDESVYFAFREKTINDFKVMNNKSGIKDEFISTYLMTTTRNKVTNYIKSIFKETSSPSNLILTNHTEDGIEIEHISVKNENNDEINIGYKKAGAIIPNCILLMAQHYYDLFLLAYEKNPQHTVFWIFDFIEKSEKWHVVKGFEVSIILMPWPANLTINIVNFIYLDEFSTYNYMTHRF